MSLSKENNTFIEFYRSVYDVAAVDPFVNRFAEFSKAGSRRKMIELINEIPCVSETTITEWYSGKDDMRAAKLYKKSIETIARGGDKCEEEIKTCGILTKALFAASACSLVFIDALLERARRWYNLKAYAKCLKDCECMLALPTSLFERSVETVNSFMERRKECLRLERECTKKLETISSRRKRIRGKNATMHGSDSTLIDNRALTTPPVFGKAHSIIQSCSDAVALQFDKKKGRQLVASRAIKTGSVLVVDEPFSFSTDEVALGRNCLHCHASLKLEGSIRIPCYNCQTVSFCTEKCRSKAWQMYHRYECTVFEFLFKNGSKQPHRQASHLLLAYRTTVRKLLSSTPALNINFLQRYTADMKNDAEENENANSPKIISSELGINKIYKSLDYETVYQLKTHCADVAPNVNLVQTIEAIFLAKCLIFSINETDNDVSREMLVLLAADMLQHLQAVNCNAYEIVENVRDETTRVWDPRYVGGAIYPTVSLINHSCYPNVVRHTYPNGMVVVRALRFIDKGAEILDCYGPHFLSEGRLARREYLWKKYHFLCACDACTHNWQLPLPETVDYKCRVCSTKINAESKNCSECQEKIDYKKLEKQFRKSTEKRINAITKMYQGQYQEALSILLGHADFIEQFLVPPNIEAIKTQQCIVQCYNSFSRTSI